MYGQSELHPNPTHEPDGDPRRAQVRRNNDPYRPYAVRYQEDDENNIPGNRGDADDERMAPDDENIQPYAVAYMEEVMEEERTSGSSQNRAATNNSARMNARGHDVSRDDADTSVADLNDSNIHRNEVPSNPLPPNPADARNALNPNPMHVPNAQRCPTKNLGSKAATLRLTSSSPQSATLPSISESSPDNFDRRKEGGTPGGNLKSVTIYGGEGPGHLTRGLGVAVSSDGEVFVTVADYDALEDDNDVNRVQVFSMTGEFLRTIPTALPSGTGRKTMSPTGVAIDGKGYLWVIGVTVHGEHGDQFKPHAVQYDRQDGLPVTSLDIQLKSTVPDQEPAIAVDLQTSKIIVAVYNEILLFLPSGTLYQSFVFREVSDVLYLTANSGNIFVTHHGGASAYDHSGHHLFSFDGNANEEGEGQTLFATGIYKGTSGNIIVGNSGYSRVDMFTSQGEFVRTVVEIVNPGAFALGPDGQLVVTSQEDSVVIIFPRQMLFHV
ncbi:TRIM3 [Branchiostoma lanceolatum]|uniref:TRIM3 protein n=1 Tax=Branchiostoma lanceolatum TaxID=7740 RepID=A0A8J9W199_BRALA|nr:TRIM3 [Branchiostoma lanceolatum]